MVRADYCGDGRSYTRDGTMIEVEDAFGILGDGGLPSPTRRFEAAWGPEGATCVDHVRVPARGTLEDVLRACPRLAGRLGQACTPARPDPAGALLTNRS